MTRITRMTRMTRIPRIPRITGTRTTTATTRTMTMVRVATCRLNNHSNSGEDNNAAVIGSCSVVGDVPSMIGPFSNSFTVEVELSHLLRKKGCNLNLFKPVFEWAI